MQSSWRRLIRFQCAEHSRVVRKYRAAFKVPHAAFVLEVLTAKQEEQVSLCCWERDVSQWLFSVGGLMLTCNPQVTGAIIGKGRVRPDSLCPSRKWVQFTFIWLLECFGVCWWPLTLPPFPRVLSFLMTCLHVHALPAPSATPPPPPPPGLTLRAPLSRTFLQTLPDLVTPLKGYSLSPRSCPAMRSAPSERFGN